MLLLLEQLLVYLKVGLAFALWKLYAINHVLGTGHCRELLMVSHQLLLLKLQHMAIVQFCSRSTRTVAEGQHVIVIISGVCLRRTPWHLLTGGNWLLGQVHLVHLLLGGLVLRHGRLVRRLLLHLHHLLLLVEELKGVLLGHCKLLLLVQVESLRRLRLFLLGVVPA